jgi:hypothetical protein
VLGPYALVIPRFDLHPLLEQHVLNPVFEVLFDRLGEPRNLLPARFEAFHGARADRAEPCGGPRRLFAAPRLAFGLRRARLALGSVPSFASGALSGVSTAAGLGSAGAARFSRRGVRAFRPAEGRFRGRRLAATAERLAPSLGAAPGLFGVPAPPGLAFDGTHL